MRRISGKITLPKIVWTFRSRISVTWFLVLIENLLMAVTPLLMGFSIDGLLAGRVQELMWLALVLLLWTLVAVVRRLYDTRVYGSVRIELGTSVTDKHAKLNVSARNARLDMSRELIDFLEEEVPELITAIIQITITLIILSSFDLYLGLSCLLVTIGMLLIYAFFHKSFYRLNAAFNEQSEKQVDILHQGRRLSIFRHLRSLRLSEVRISDTEATVYGAIFLIQIVFMIFILYWSAQLAGITAGRIFSIATYAWEYLDIALLLPMTLQSWSRLSEITERINAPSTANTKFDK